MSDKTRCSGRLVGPPRGHRCLRMTTHPSGFCPQHREPDESPLVSELVEVCRTHDGIRENIRIATYPPGAQVGRIECGECSGSGWWGFGPTEEVNGPCIACKGTGLDWVGLA